MKTRIIQNEPEAPAKNGQTADATAGEPTRSRNLAARMGRWSAGHKKTAIFGWLAFIAVAFLIGNAVGTKQLDQNKVGTGESGHVDSVLRDEFKQAQVDQILIQSATKTVDDPAFRAAIADVVRTVGGMKQVKKVESPFTAGNTERISSDRHTALVALEQFGLNAETQLDSAVVNDFKKAGLFSLPVTLIVLVVAFGALIAAGLPLLLALTAVFATMGVLALPSHLMPLDKDISVIVLLIGLAVGVDYSLFYLKRDREERAAGRGERAALEAAAATSGRSVLVSGLTVMVAMAGMFLTGDATFASFGYATMIVVA